MKRPLELTPAEIAILIPFLDQAVENAADAIELAELDDQEAARLLHDDYRRRFRLLQGIRRKLHAQLDAL